jgi:hypothetical protein
MKKSKYTEEQVTYALRQPVNGPRVNLDVRLY